MLLFTRLAFSMLLVNYACLICICLKGTGDVSLPKFGISDCSLLIKLSSVEPLKAAKSLLLLGVCLGVCLGVFLTEAFLELAAD